MADMVKIAVIFLLNIQNAFCQGFAADSDIVTGGTVKLVCDVTIAAFTAPVILFKDNVQKTSCDNGNICTSYSSDSGRYQYSSNVSAVTVQISNLTKANDEGTWVCRVGTSHSYTHNLVFPSTENPDNEEQINSACTGSFHCGFWLLLLAVVTSIIILILMWRKVKRFGFSASGFSKMKIGITGVFSFVAVGIGLGLGFGLQAGQANCLECGATIGISIALGVALSVIQFIVIINCDKEKGCDGNSKGFSLDNCFRKCSVKPDVDKKETDRSNGDRARTPASATGINLETKKN